ncbi:MAG TPA: hypothetical protein VL967_04725 [Terracidiphilus sp.]|nr:hypothetical protein [Terracidiphilus sp.]
MPPVAFVRRINPDGSQTSHCSECLRLVATASTEVVLDVAEHLHICSPSDGEGAARDCVTLTERVLTFLEGHSA